jgi:hexosaminidase
MRYFRSDVLLRSLLISVGVLRAAPLTPNMMPLPAHWESRSGELAIGIDFQVAVTGYRDSRLDAAVQRFSDRLSRQAGIPFFPKGMRASLTIECQGAAPTYPKLGEDEAYQLEVTESGATLRANTTTGILRGLETFLQLAGPGERGMRVPAIHIEDQPRFPWRGLMLDVSRHWMPPPVVFRTLDGMASVKLNVFHWHLSDDQGFRVESKRFPKLQQLGSDGHFYTQQTVKQVVEYAADRGIRVIPEFDIPGHTSSWLAAYPELASMPGTYSIERTWGVFHPVLDPTREQTYAFLNTLLGEMAALFPDPYFHIGGDEVDDADWKASASIQKFEQAHQIKTSHELQAYFNHRVQAILHKCGKTMVGWDEVIEPGLATDTVIQSWRGAESLSDAARKGYRAILSGGYYLDHLKPASEHYEVDPLAGEATQLSASDAARILGGEACMWTEYASPETVDSRLWPRLAAIAERFWSPQDIRDTGSMYARLSFVTRLLGYAGVENRSNFVPMLDRLTGDQGSQAVVDLADAVEALGIVGRRDEHKYSSLVPLNRLVDAARPESEPARRLTLAVGAWLGAPTADAGSLIRQQLLTWAMTPVALHELAPGNYLLTDLLPVAENLGHVGDIGIKALDFLDKRQAPPEGWAASQLQALTEYEKPKAEIRLAAVRPVRLLVEALAANQGNVKPVTH